MNVGKGHWIFAIIFFVVFVASMIWAYRKDKPAGKIHYTGIFRLLFFMLLVLWLVYMFVRLKPG
jgi:uncharacterized membrane protein YtjA (UPF0391 family)